VDAQHKLEQAFFPYLQGFFMETARSMAQRLKCVGEARISMWLSQYGDIDSLFLTALQQLMHIISGVVASYFFINRNFCLLRRPC